MYSRQQALEIRNYYNDPRVVAGFRISLLEDLDLRSMTAYFRRYEGDLETMEEVYLCFEVCPACEGRGVMVNPSIDAGGLTSEDLAEIEYDDPDFLDRYRQGMYDVPCSTCNGRRVVPALDRQRTDPDVVKAYDEQEEQDAYYASMHAAERAAGA